MALLQQLAEVGLGLPVAGSALQLFVMVFAIFAWALARCSFMAFAFAPKQALLQFPDLGLCLL